MNTHTFYIITEFKHSSIDRVREGIIPFPGLLHFNHWSLPYGAEC